jgi:diguanylate cyclase (GGDEF)-like protein
MSQNTFRQRVLSLAAMLVTSVQLLTLLPVLNAVKTDVEQRARQTVTIGGSVFDEFMRARSEQLRTTVDVLVSDFGFKQAVASADTETIRSVLLNHSGRVDADMGVLLDLDGNILANSSVDPSQQELTSLATFVTSDANIGATDVVVYADGVPYQSVVVPLRAPLPIAWVVMGFQLDRELAARVEGLTGLEVSFLDRSRGSAGRLLESTLPAGRQASLAGAIERIRLGSTNIATLAIADVDYLTVLRPFSSASAHVQVALQLSLADAMARYRDIRTILLVVTLFSLLLAVTGTYWLAGTVTKPVYRLVAATRRLREGVYSEPIEVPKSDEFGELAMNFNAMQQAIAEREERIAFQAYHDALSGLPNRERLLQLLEPLLERNQSLTVISFSIDRFDQIASSLGHSASDEVLKLVADMLKQNLRDGQYLAHLGGNEFLVSLEGADSDGAGRWVDHLGHLLHAGVSLAGANISLKATAGVALFPDHSDNGPDLLRRAAVARTNAVTSRESFAVFMPGDEDRHRQQIKIIGDFPAAVSNDELCLYLQPKISCTTHAVTGAEALVRWDHPQLGFLQPADFVDVIEGAGVIGHLTHWVTKEAVRQCRHWRDAGLELTVAVNLSVYDLLDEYLPYFLMDTVKENGLHASDLTLEITESAIMHNVSLSLTVLECVRDLGFGVTLDDFGTGQSSLTQLRRLPLDEVKIDKSFVMNMSDQKDDVIVQATIELAHKLGLRVVGEGVETAELLDRLTELGCESAQGYYMSKPMPADTFPSWARRWQLAHNPNVIELKPSPAEIA